MEPKVEPTKPNTQLTSIPVIYKRGEYRDRLIKDQCRYMTHKRFNEFPFQEGERNGDA